MTVEDTSFIPRDMSNVSCSISKFKDNIVTILVILCMTDVVQCITYK